MQRSLSADDLLQRYRGQQQNIQGQNPPAIPIPSRRPAMPPDLNQAARLSTKLPDPPVFNGTNSHIPFDD